jgi:hypothetical protein
MSMMHLRRLLGMHWHIVSRLEMKLETCLEKALKSQLRYRSIRVKVRDVHAKPDDT